MCTQPSFVFFFFFNDTATTEIYPLSLHDALPISRARRLPHGDVEPEPRGRQPGPADARGASCQDRKSTRLNSSHSQISYAVFCLKKKKRRSLRCGPRSDHSSRLRLKTILHNLRHY